MLRSSPAAAVLSSRVCLGRVSRGGARLAGIDMSKMMEIQKMAVDSGYWPLYRYNPNRSLAGENPFQV